MRVEPIRSGQYPKPALPLGRRTRNLCAFLALLALLLPGCLEFDAQDLFVRYDPAADRLDLMLVYRGLYSQESGSGGNGSGTRLDEAVKHIDEALATGWFALWNNWPLNLNPTRKDSPEVRLVSPYLAVENGKLFRDQDGRLCGYQFIRVTKVKALLKSLNTAFGLALQASGVANGKLQLPSGMREIDEETVERLTDSLRAGNPLLRLKGACLELSLPCSDADHAKLRASLFDEILSEVVSDLTWVVRIKGDKDAPPALDLSDREAVRRAVAASPTLRFARDNDVALLRDGPITKVTVGVPGRDSAVFRKAPHGRYQPELMKALVERRAPPIEGVITEETLVKRFEEFRAREPVRPAARPETQSRPGR